MNQTLLVNRSGFSDVKSVEQPDGDLADGHIRVEIGPFCHSSRDWLSVETYEGEEALLSNDHALLAGQASPAVGQLFKL